MSTRKGKGRDKARAGKELRKKSEDEIPAQSHPPLPSKTETNKGEVTMSTKEMDSKVKDLRELPMLQEAASLPDDEAIEKLKEVISNDG